MKLSQQSENLNEFGDSTGGIEKQYFKYISEALPARAFSRYASVPLNTRITLGAQPMAASGSFSIRFVGRVDYTASAASGCVFDWEAGNIGPVGSAEKGISLSVKESQGGSGMSSSGLALFVGDGTLEAFEWGNNEKLDEWHD